MAIARAPVAGLRCHHRRIARRPGLPVGRNQRIVRNGRSRWSEIPGHRRSHRCERIYYNFMRPTMSEEGWIANSLARKALDYDLVKTYVRLPHAWPEKAVEFAHSNSASWSHRTTCFRHELRHGRDDHLSATARLGYAYTRSPGGVSYSDVRTLFAQSGEFDISTPFQSFVLYADDPAMVDDKRLQVLNTPWDEGVLKMKLGLSQGQPPTGIGASSDRRPSRRTGSRRRWRPSRPSSMAAAPCSPEPMRLSITSPRRCT